MHLVLDVRISECFLPYARRPAFAARRARVTISIEIEERRGRGGRHP